MYSVLYVDAYKEEKCSTITFMTKAFQRCFVLNDKAQCIQFTCSGQ